MSDEITEIKTTGVNRLFVGFIAQRPLVAVLLGLGLVVGLASGMGKLRADFTHTGFFFDDDPKLKRFEAFERRFGNDDSVIVAMHSPSGVFDLESARLLQELTDKMWKIPEIIRVDSLANFNWVHARGDDIAIEPLFPDQLTPEILASRKQIALTHETLPNYLVSKDATVAMVFARVKPGIEHPPNASAISRAAEALMASLQRGDHTFYISGGPSITYEFERVTQKDIGRLIPMAILLAALFLAFLLRSVAGTLLPFVVVIGGALAAFGFAGHVGLVQTAMVTVVPSILIAVGIADTVHILVTYFDVRRRGWDRRRAAHYALTKNLLATFLTSLTTAIGFASFLTANLKPLGIMGAMAAVGTFVAWIVAQLVVGGLLFVLPIKVKALPAQRVVNTKRRATGLVDFIARNRIRVMVGTAIFSVVCAYVSFGIEINSDPMKYFGKDVPGRVASDFIEASTGAARILELEIDSGQDEGVKDPTFLAKVDEFQQWIQKQPDITRAVSIVDVLKQTHRSLNGDKPEFYALSTDRDTIAQELFLYTMGLPQGMDINDRISVKNDALRMTVLNKLLTSREYVAATQAIEAKGRSLGLKVEGTGKYYLYQQTNEYVVQSFVRSLWSASLLIGLIMAFFLRSWKLGIISMIPNVVPLFAGGVLLRMIGQPLDIGTSLVASVCLGISIDDTSHVLANFAYMRKNGMAPNAALRVVLAETGPALLSTNGILITSFASFATASFVPNVYFGVMTAFVLTIALAADMLFTPAILSESPAREAARNGGAAAVVAAGAPAAAE